MFLLIAHFDTEGTGAGRGTDAAGRNTDAAGPAGDAPAGSAEAIRALGDQPGTRSVRWARSTEHPGRWVLVAEFDTAAAFRAAQSPLPVRAVLIPWLAGARSSAAFEVVRGADGGRWFEPEVIVDDPGR